MWIYVGWNLIAKTSTWYTSRENSFPTKYEIFSQAIRESYNHVHRDIYHELQCHYHVPLRTCYPLFLSTPLITTTSDNNLRMHKTQQLRRYDNTIAYTRPDQMNRDETRWERSNGHIVMFGINFRTLYIFFANSNNSSCYIVFLTKDFARFCNFASRTYIPCQSETLWIFSRPAYHEELFESHCSVRTNRPGRKHAKLRPAIQASPLLSAGASSSLRFFPCFFLRLPMVMSLSRKDYQYEIFKPARLVAIELFHRYSLPVDE